ncbi:MAG TPA: DNA polymerase III subunit delta' [Xanthobacteraceae bacterium]|jgi:DNA polymerase-3 subunit delta'|nr:DNA polymerase III subunit delta' [Xanthobacteraceae bacterium]
MSPRAAIDDDDIDEAPHPRATTELFGHAPAEAALLAAYRSGRVPHAFLIAGPQGIGKATLAYRMARFVLAHPDPLSHEVQTAGSLAVDAKDPVARRIAAQAQPDLLILERRFNDKGVLHKQIAVDDIRRTVAFFGSTAGEGGWRVAIVDAVDELNRAGANALLKVLEEPPERALLLLVSHSAARVIATLRSRCRILTLRPLGNADVAKAVATAMDAGADDPHIAAAAAAAEGSVARAMLLMDEGALALRQQAIEMLDRLPSLDAKALHDLGEALAGTDPQPLAAFVDTVSVWLSRRLGGGLNDIGRLDRLAEAWQRINAAARDAETYNLERKPLIFNVFGLLAEATRG